MNVYRQIIGQINEVESSRGVFLRLLSESLDALAQRPLCRCFIGLPLTGRFRANHLVGGESARFNRRRHVADHDR